MTEKIKFLAYYLPQYHPIPENDQWWGKGFTEWTNVVKAKPLFKGHFQPRLPTDLGFYDLRIAEVREQQAKMARDFGLDGFVYYHYWFGNGKMLLERPFQEVLASGKPDFPFMLCWANESWKGVWFGGDAAETLIEQQYPGAKDYQDHFSYLLPAFKDERYIKVDGKPVFQVYKPMEIPDLSLFVSAFRESAARAGLPGIYLMACNCDDTWNPHEYGFDGLVSNNFHSVRYRRQWSYFRNESTFLSKLLLKLKSVLKIKFRDVGERNTPYIMHYDTMHRLVTNWPDCPFDYFPVVIPDWDNAPRAGKKSFILKGSTPQKWEAHLDAGCQYLIQKIDQKNKFLFIKSWNEWAEGNYLEPDKKWGLAYLEATLNVVKKNFPIY